MAALPDGLASATRRHYAQLISKVLRIAEYPCRLIERSPLPRGFLPKIGARPALSYLYPAEDERLMACSEVPLGRRVLYGMLAREGLRMGEALALGWHHLDLEHGTVRLDRTKTGEARTWALSDGVTEALRRFRLLHAAGDRVFTRISDHSARVFREDLKTAGLARPELFERSAHRRPIRAHDLRAKFITLSRAGGRSEAGCRTAPDTRRARC
jgi:integrase